jgi:hypothetical protein
LNWMLYPRVECRMSRWVLYCARYLTDAVVLYLNVIARYLLVHAITSFFNNIRCWKCGC